MTNWTEQRYYFSATSFYGKSRFFVVICNQLSFFFLDSFMKQFRPSIIELVVHPTKKLFFCSMMKEGCQFVKTNITASETFDKKNLKKNRTFADTKLSLF